jgi:hypothetical protein
MRITIIDQETGVARDYNVGPAVLVGAIALVVPAEFGHEAGARIFELVTMSGLPLNPEHTVGIACRDRGIYTLRCGSLRPEAFSPR